MAHYAIFIFSGIVGLAVFLRLYKLKQRGVLHFDDGLRMLEIVFLDELANYLKEVFPAIRARKKIDMKPAAEAFKGRYLFDTNPLNIFIYFFSSRILKNIEHSALYANAVFGILGVLGTYYTSLLMFHSTAAALFAALFISISGYHLIYSRSIHAEVTCGAFYVWAVFFYLLSCKTGMMFYLLVSGFLVGCAFCCNTRQFYMPLFFFFWEILADFKYSFSLDVILTRYILLGVSMAAPLFIIEEIFVVLKELNYPYPSFFRQLFFRTGNFRPPSIKLPFLKMYVGILLEYEGIITLLALLSGIFFLFKSVSFEGVLLLTQFLVPLLFWSGRPDISKEEAQKIDDGTGGYAYALPRLISSSLYSMAIIAALGLSAFLNLDKDMKLFNILLIVVLSSRILPLFKFVSIKSGYKHAAEFLLSSGNPRHISYCYPNSEFLTGKANTIDVSSLKSETEIRELCAKKNVYFVLYSDFLRENLYKSAAVDTFIDKVVNGTRPVFAIPTGMGDIKALYTEEYNSPWAIIFLNDEIKIYDLRNYFDKIKEG